MATNKEEIKSLLKDRPYWREGDCIFFVLQNAEMIDLWHIKRISYYYDNGLNLYGPDDTISVAFHNDNEDIITIEYPWTKNFIADMRDLFKDFAEIRSRAAVKEITK